MLKKVPFQKKAYQRFRISARLLVQRVNVLQIVFLYMVQKATEDGAAVLVLDLVLAVLITGLKSFSKECGVGVERSAECR